MLHYNSLRIFFKTKAVYSINLFVLIFKLIKLKFALVINYSFVGFYSSFKSVKRDIDNGFVLVQLIEDFEFAFKLGASAKALSDKFECNIEILDCYWDVRLSKPNFQKVFNFIGLNTPIQSIYSNFGNSSLFSNSNKYKDQGFISLRTDEIYNSLICTSDILNIKVENILIGDLIYDTYLRYYHKPTIYEINSNLKYLIRISLDIFYSFKEFIKTNKIQALVQVYTTYITHGITVRLCLNSGIRVFCVASDSYIIQEVTNEFPYHGINHSLFSADAKISDEDLRISKNMLEVRFNGGVDSATSYMKTSSYFESNNYEILKELFNKRERNIVIYTHDFFDSPHINRSLQFDDLYRFLEATLMFLNTVDNSSVFIKIHPNGLLGADHIAKQLVRSFNNPNFYILDKDVSNLDIIKLNPDIIGTARGTIGVEMAYFSIPVVALYDNIYINFDFVHNCNTKEEYFSVLSGETKPNCNFDKINIYKFYYQAYLQNKKNDENFILDKIKFKNIDSYSVDYIKNFVSSVSMYDIQCLNKLYTNSLVTNEFL